MRIMVFDVPAESGGALSVLSDFYYLAVNDTNKDNEWFFVLSKPHFDDHERVKVIRFPWIKRSWFHRLYFDYIIANRLINEYRINRVFSLQNVIIPFIRVPQILYVHNSLPFIEYRFSIFSNMLLWIYQNIISIQIQSSIKKADHIIAQTKWMKQKFVDRLFIPEERISVVPPQVNVDVGEAFNENCLNKGVVFFYPASAIEFKNHKIIVEACKRLEEVGCSYQVILTISGEENNNISKLKLYAEKHNLKINFIGQITREEVFNKYSETVLVFPSYVESSPLPLTEAMMHKCMIISTNCDFSKEILNGYVNAYLFDPFNHIELSEIMLKIVNHEIRYNNYQTESDISSYANLNLLDIVSKA